jgi:hypothetical protein
MSRSLKSLKKEPLEIKHAQCLWKRVSYKKEMEKMSIINNPFQKAGQQQGVTYALSQPLTIGASNVSQITVSNDGTLRAKRVVESEITSAMLES